MFAEVRIISQDKVYFSTLKVGEFVTRNDEIFVKIPTANVGCLKANALCLNDGRAIYFSQVDLVYEAKNVKITCERGGA